MGGIMKQLFKSLSLALLAVAAISCAKEISNSTVEHEIPGSTVRKVVIKSATEDTKTTILNDLRSTTWDNTPASMLHVWENDNEASYILSDNNEDGIIDALTDGALDVVAEFTTPRPSSAVYYSLVANQVKSKELVTLPSDQNPCASSFDPKADILVAKPQAVAEVPETPELLMPYARPVSVGLFTLKGLEAGEKINKVVIKTDCNLAGDIKLSYTTGGASSTCLEEGAVKELTLNYTANNNVPVSGEFPVFFTAFPATISTLEITVETDKHKYNREATGLNLELNVDRVLSRGFKLDQADKADALPGGYVKVTSAPADWSGKYLIVYESSATAANVFNGLDASNANVSATIQSGNKIFSNATTNYDDYAVEIAACGEGYSVKVLKGAGETNKGKYLYSSNLSGNTLGFSSDPQANTISYESQGYVLIAMTDGTNSRAIRFNSDSRNMRFRYFDASTQQPVQLYRLESAGYDKYALGTPSEISFSEETKRISWNAVEHAASYKIFINEEDGIACDDCYFDASELDPDYYNVAVQAIASNDDETYKDSAISAIQELVIGTPQLKKPSFATNAEVTVASITVSWATSDLDDRATNGYHLYLTENENDAEIIEGTERDVISETSTTFSNLEDNHQYRVYIYANAVTTPKEYAQSRTTYKTVRTAGYTTIEAITSAGSYAVKDAVVYAVATSGFWMNDGTAGIYCAVTQSNADLLGKIVIVEGPVAISDSQLRFQSTSVVTTTGTKEDFDQPTPTILDKVALQNQLTTFTKGAYVQYSGKYESSNKRVNMDATSAKGTIYNPFSSTMTGIANNDYVTVCGYLTHISSSAYVNTLVTSVVKNTLSAEKQDGWKDWEYDVYGEANKQIITVLTDNSADWTFTLENRDGWSVTRVGNTLEVYPNGSNSQEATKSATITVRHGVNLVLTQTVVCNQKANVYMPVSASEITDGIYLIAYQHTDGKYYLMNTSVISNNFIGSDGFANLSKTTNIDDKYKFYIEKESSTSSWYVITTSADKYLYMTSSYLKNDRNITAAVSNDSRWKFTAITNSEAIKATTSSVTSKWISWQMYDNNTPEYYLSSTNANAPKFYRYGDIPSYIRPSQPAEVAYNGTSTTITLKSNVEWNVKSSDPTNFSVTKTNATTATVTLTVNESCSSSRNATISFWGGDILESDPVTVQVTQNVHPTPVINASNPSAVGHDVTSVEVSYTITNPHESGSIAAEISNGAASWISNPQYASGKVTFTLTPNTGAEKREGTVTLKYPDATDKPITITQNADGVVTYTMVTSASQITAGTYLIAALRSTSKSDNFYFAKGTISSGDMVVTDNATSIPEAGGARTITGLPESAVEFTLTGNNTSGFTIAKGSEYLYMTAQSTNRKLAFASDKSAYKWKFNAKTSPLITGGVVVKYVSNSASGVSGDYTISENSTGPGAIRGYSGTTEYRAVYLFKKN